MKVREIITEYKIRRISAPYTGGAGSNRLNKQGRAARQRLEKFNSLPTAKEKFDFLYNANLSSHVVRIGSLDYNDPVIDYDPTTGIAKVKGKTNSVDKYNEPYIFTVNVNDLKYLGRRRTGSRISYVFGNLSDADEN